MMKKLAWIALSIYCWPFTLFLGLVVIFGIKLQFSSVYLMSSTGVWQFLKLIPKPIKIFLIGWAFSLCTLLYVVIVMVK